MGLTLTASLTPRQLLLISLLIGLLAAAVFTRFYRLGTPGELYFDEVYFPTTAQEIVRGDPAAWEWFGHENTHPPLSKLFMAGGMAIFGVVSSGSITGEVENPFAWRFFGALAGIGSVVFIYLLGKRLFNSEIVGIAAAFLMVFEGLSFVQSRMATPDTFLVFFVLGVIYFLLSDRYLYSGIFFGAALATKLTALMIVFPIVIYFVYRYWLAQQGKGAGLLYLAPFALLGFYLGTPALFGGFLVDEVQPGVLRPDVSAPVFNAALGSWMALCALAPIGLYFIYRSSHPRERDEEYALAGSLAILPLFFVVVPLSIYLLTYVPMLFSGHTLEDVLLLNREGFQFHSTLDATHPYQSPWNTWPIMMRPVFLYVSAGDAKIYSLGNPIIFWLGLPALGFALWQGLAGVRAKLDEATGRLSLSGSVGPEQAALLFVVLAYLGFFLPWAIQPRIMFIYHYLPSVPFLLLALAYVIHRLWQQSWGSTIATAFAVVAALTFLMLVLGHATDWPWQPPWGRTGAIASFLAVGAVFFVTLAMGHVIERLWRQPWGRTAAVAFLVVAVLTFAYFYPHLAAWDVPDAWADSFFWSDSWR
jgi:dolichyl-phosphate-mannose-protein mannosyltransferase